MQGETTYFTHIFTTGGPVRIVFGTPTHVFLDVLTRRYHVGELTQIIVDGKSVHVGEMLVAENHRLYVHVETIVVDFFYDTVQLKPRP